MKLSTAINKARRVYVTTTIANCGVSLPISKALARTAVAEFLDMTTSDGETFNDGYDAAIGWYDQNSNILYIG